MALPYLAALGWSAQVLAVEPGFVEAAQDRALAATVPPGVRVHRVPALSPIQSRRLGWGSLARRALPFLRVHGTEILARGRFDLVFFSTSQFGVLPLALEWRRRFGVPYVLDFQDEWVSDYYRRHPLVTPPGGRWKYALSRALACGQEGRVVRDAAQIVVVSELYRRNLRRRHGLPADRVHVLPFGGKPEDFTDPAFARSAQDYFRPGGGLNWVYVGRGGPALRLAATSFFLALRRALLKGIVAPDRFRFHCLGTAYATGELAEESFTSLAVEAGVSDQVVEVTARLPYFTALRCLREADATIVFGSDDPGYAASKIMPCILAGRPLLGIFHEDCECVRLLRETGAGTAVTFRSNENAPRVAARIFRDWFANGNFRKAFNVDPAALAPHTAEEMSWRLDTIFRAACGIAAVP